MPTTAEPDLGALLRGAREEAGLTQAQLAARVDGRGPGKPVTVQTVSNWERNRTEPTWSQLIQLAAALPPNADLLRAAERAVAAEDEVRTR